MTIPEDIGASAVSLLRAIRERGEWDHRGIDEYWFAIPQWMTRDIDSVLEAADAEEKS